MTSHPAPPPAPAFARSPLGATLLNGNRCSFLVWAPYLASLMIHLPTPTGARRVPCHHDAGYHFALIENVRDGDLYWLELEDGSLIPDPASRFQPLGVHGPSAVVDPRFPWTDSKWRGLPLHRCVLYELHTGTFTPQGTFDAIIPCLPELVDLGVTAIELMPVAQFSGLRNWGYDGVGLFAAQHSYGGPHALRRLVDAAHRHGLAVILDVVFNHLGPEGNHLTRLGPYFHPHRQTPWGPALNFDSEFSAEVRRFLRECALYWITDCHIDGLRLDALQEIHDASPSPFLAELASALKQRAAALHRTVLLFGETPENDRRLLDPPSRGGCGLDALWSFDFHYSLRTLLTGERQGYLADYDGIRHLAKCLREGWGYTGEFAPSRGKQRGSPTTKLSGKRFVVYAQNHDHTGNRRLGERLGRLVSPQALIAAAAALLLAPFVPLLFMGEEYDDPAPFLYFTDHSTEALAAAVRVGRKAEFAASGWQGEPPDPQAEETFLNSKLRRSLRHHGWHAALWDFYRALLRLRHTHPALKTLSRRRCLTHGWDSPPLLTLHRRRGPHALFALISFSPSPAQLTVPIPHGAWRRLLDSHAPCFHGEGILSPEALPGGPAQLTLLPFSVLIYERLPNASTETSARKFATPAV